jgi:hypothetical protein
LYWKLRLGKKICHEKAILEESSLKRLIENDEAKDSAVLHTVSDVHSKGGGRGERIFFIALVESERSANLGRQRPPQDLRSNRIQNPSTTIILGKML